jgi:hypothetical protein
MNNEKQLIGGVHSCKKENESNKQLEETIKELKYKLEGFKREIEIEKGKIEWYEECIKAQIQASKELQEVIDKLEGKHPVTATITIDASKIVAVLDKLRGNVKR